MDALEIFRLVATEFLDMELTHSLSFILIRFQKNGLEVPIKRLLLI